MNQNITFAPRPGSSRGATLFSLLIIALLGVFAICIGAVIGGCSRSQVATATTAAESIPQPNADVTASIRTRVAAVVAKEVKAHPATAPWVNGLAKACFEISGAKLPDPAVLQSLFGAVSVFAPKDIASPISAVLTEYAKDYGTASALQGGSKAYLTALGLGIQDGVKQAAVVQVAESLAGYVTIGLALYDAHSTAHVPTDLAGSPGEAP